MSGGGSSSREASHTGLDPYQKRVADPFSAFLAKQFGGGAVQGATPYEGILTAPLGTGTQGVLDALMAAYPTASRAFQTASSLDPAELESRFNAMIRAPAEQYYREYTEPAVREAYGGPGGYYSSERQRAQVKTAQDFATQLAQQRGEFETGERQRALEAAMSGAGYAGQVASLADLPRQMEQEAINRDYQEFLRTAPEYSPYIEYITQILSGPWESQAKAKSSSWSFGIL